MDSREIAERVGTTLCNKYTLDKLLGVGGMASVYRGKHRNGNRVAIKILHTELSASRDIRARFLREGYAANQVDHRGVVKVLDDDVAEDGSPFLVMELLEGETLEDFTTRCGGTLSARELVPLVGQLLDVLVAAHRQGIVHRDIKPDNVFIEREGGTLKVLDFGIARMAGSHTATRTGQMMGTPAYMSPEHARGHTKLVDGQTDVWAVGAIFFRCLTGRFVHHGETPEMTLVAAATEPAPRLAPFVPGVGHELCAIVDRALATSKEERWPTADAMLQALRALDVERLPDLRMPSSRPKTLDGGRLVESLPPRGDGTTAPMLHALPPSEPAPVLAASARPSTDIARGASVASGPSRPAPRWGLAVLGSTILALGGAVAVVAASDGVAPASGAASSVTSASASAATSAAQAGPSYSGGAALPAASVPLVSASSLPAAPAPRPSAQPAARPSGQPLAPRPSAQPARNPNCDPSYVVDKDGEKHFKPECFSVPTQPVLP